MKEKSAPSLHEIYLIANCTTLTYIKTIYFQTPEQLSLTQKLSSTFDVNPAFKFLSAIIPGFSSDAKVHDAQYEGEKRDEVLQKNIIPSFIATDYSIIFGKLPSLLKEKTSKDNEQTNKGGK